MNNHSETLTGGIQQILYGLLKPEQVLERYELKQADDALYHRLTNFPSSPESYLSLHDSVQTRWLSVINSSDRRRYEDIDGEGDTAKEANEDSSFAEWLPPFYTLSADPSGAFHILCDFYSSFIRAECRIMLQVTESRKVDLPVTMLTYEIVTLRDELLELVRESSVRYKQHHHTTEAGHLSRFVYKALLNHLIPTLFELQHRTRHLLDERIVSKRDLYLTYLKQPMPFDTPWHRTVSLTRFDLELACRTPDAPEKLRRIEDLLKSVRQELPASRRSDLRDSLSLLENAWFCLFISTQAKSWNTLDINNTDQCAQKIDDIHHRLFNSIGETDKSVPAEIIEILIQSFDRIQSVIKSGDAGSPSATARFMMSVESHYNGSISTETSPGPGLMHLPAGAPIVRETPSPSVLDQYIPVDLLKEKLAVTQKSMNKYLSDSKTPVYNLTNKNRLIHIDDFKAMMKHYKTTL